VIMMTADDWGTQNNLFASPKVYRNLFLPYYQRINAACHQIAPVMPHTRKDFPLQKMSQPSPIQTTVTVIAASIPEQYSPPTRLTSHPPRSVGFSPPALPHAVSAIAIRRERGASA